MGTNPFELPESEGPKGSNRHISWKAPLVFGWVIFLTLLCIFVIWQKVANDNARISTQASEQVDAGEIDLPDLGAADDALATNAKGRTLEVNGQLKVNNSLILDPSDPPKNPVIGQVYYDKTSNTPMYYDGTKFVAVASRQDIQVNSAPVLQSTSFASVVLEQPLTIPRDGILIGDGNGAISSVTAGSTGLCLLSSTGSPSFQSCPVGGATPNAVTSTTNTSGSIAKIGAGNTIVDSLLSDDGTAISVNGVLSLGANNLQLGNNGFGMTLNTTTLSANRSVLLPDESGIVCLHNSSSCGFITGTPANFIQNQNVGAQAGSNYWVAGVGRADGGLIGPSFDTASGGVLTIGGNSSAISINDDTTINGALQVALNSASVNSPLLQLEQTGSGDSTIELKNSSGASFYVGMDQSAGGVLRIGSSTSARTTTTSGTTSIGGAAFQGVEAQIIAKKVITGPADSGSLSSIVVHLSSVDVSSSGIKVAIYDHDAANNRPGTLIAATSTAASGSVGWNTVPLSAPIANNTTYWIALNVEGSGTGVSYDHCGGCAGDSTTTYPRPFNNVWPATHGVPNNVLNSQEWSFNMRVASGAVNDTFAGARLFSLTDSGSLTLQNSTDTTTAFQIQNAAGVNLLTVDTANTKITMGTDLILAANKSLTVNGGATGTRPGAPTEGMVYYDTDTKKLLTYANGKWQADRSNAVIVAASNSSQADKDAADYVTDGNTGAADDGDQAQINAALSEAAGKKVVLLAGTYTVDSFIAMPNDTTLTGVGRGSLITIPNSFNAGISLILNQDSITGSGVVIQDLHIDGNAANQSAGNIVGITLEGLGGGSGPTARQGGNVSNVTVANMRGNAIVLADSSKGIITSNAMNSNGGSGISVQNSSDSTIANNVSIGNSFYGIELDGSSSNAVSANVSRDNLGNGISLRASSNTNTVTGNTAQSNDSNGILIQNSSNSTVTGNIVTANASAGISVQTNSTSNLIGANKIHDNGGSTQNDGIFLWNADSNQITGNNITDTSATNNNYAIHIYDSTVDGSYVSDNTLGTGIINNLGTATVMGGQVGTSGNYSIQPGGSIELLKDTNVTGVLTVSGALQVNGTSRLTVNSTTAFVVQNTSNVELLRADTNLMTLTVRELEVTYDLAVGGDVSFGRHLRSGGSNPTTVTGPAACTAPTVTVSGTDTAGMVMVVAGTGCSSNGAVVTLVFANTFVAPPKVTLTPATSSASTLPAYADYSQVTATSFDIATSSALSDGVTYRWYYHAIE